MFDPCTAALCDLPPGLVMEVTVPTVVTVVTVETVVTPATVVTVPHREADRNKILAQTEKLKVETDKLGRKSTADSVIYQLDW